jgi:alkylhydroperoxidase family enzyme
MGYIPLTEYETASPEARAAYDDQIAKNGRVTNMKRTLLHSVPAFDAYMRWYTLRDLIVPFLGERALSVFAYAISEGNDCLICGTFFRKILIDAGEDPDNPALSDTERLLLDFGAAITRDPNNVPAGIYDELKARFDDTQIVLLIAFAGVMAATNIFNMVAKVDLDEVLYDDTKKGRG